jgi:uncharacterized protein YpuA (DUF1002 family)
MNEDIEKFVDDVTEHVKVLTKFEERFQNDIEVFLQAKYTNLDNSDFTNLQSEIEFHFSELLYWRKRKYEALKQIKNGLKNINE